MAYNLSEGEAGPGSRGTGERGRAQEPEGGAWESRTRGGGRAQEPEGGPKGKIGRPVNSGAACFSLRVLTLLFPIGQAL